MSYTDNDIKFVFLQLFSGDLVEAGTSKQLAFANFETFDLFKYPLGVRSIWYKFYPYVGTRNQLTDDYSLQRLETDIMKDDELKFLPLNLIRSQTLEESVLNKILEPDYKFRSYHDHYTRREHMHELEFVKYHEGILGKDQREGESNINYYIRTGLLEFLDFTTSKFQKSCPHYGLFQVISNVDLDILVSALSSNKWNVTLEYKPIKEKLVERLGYSPKTKSFPKDFYSKYDYNVLNTLIGVAIRNSRISIPTEILDKMDSQHLFDGIMNAYIDCSEYADEKYLEKYLTLKPVPPNNLYDDVIETDDKSEPIKNEYRKTINKIVRGAIYSTFTSLVILKSIVINDMSTLKRFNMSNLDVLMYIIEHVSDKTRLEQVIERFITDALPDRFSLYSIDIHDKANMQSIKIESHLPEHLPDKFVTLIVSMVKELRIRFNLTYCYIQFYPELTDQLLFANPGQIEPWFEKEIEHKDIDKNNFSELFSKMFTQSELKHPSRESTLSFTWIKTYHEEPPFEIYQSPNYNVKGETLASIWREHVNSSTVPKEMISMSYYNYMIATHGQKKNPNFAIMYTFFSNSLENKIIFCKSDIEFTEPAKLRYQIPVDYAKVKPFLHEELATNDICMFTSVTKDDWNKIAGGNDAYDVVVFSDSKDIYRNRTPLKQVIKHIIDHIEIKFDVECICNE